MIATKKQIEETKNYGFCQKTIEGINEIESNYLARAEDLHKIRSLSLYRPAWDSFEEFCMELKSLKYTSVMKLVGIHEKFVLNYKISQARIAKAGGWSTVAEILPVIKTKEDAIKWLNTAQDKTREHLRQDIKEAKTGKDMRKCAHKRTYTIRICEDCGMKERIHI